jgi:hypothetical protein
MTLQTPDGDDFAQALTDLVRLIERGGYRAADGAPLADSPAFQTVRAKLAESDAPNAEADPADSPPEYDTWRTGP